MKCKKWIVGTLALALLTACQGGNNKQANESIKTEFEVNVTNDGTSIQGGTLKYAILSDSPIAGVLNSVFYQNSSDLEVIGFFDEGLFQHDENLNITDTGIGKLTYDLDEKTVTVTIKENIKWSDGHPLTIDDYIFAFEVIGHKDYRGLRYDGNMRNIVGMQDYHDEKTDKIAGIVKNNDYSVTFKLDAIAVDVSKAGGLWSSPLPKHVFGNMAVKDMAASDAVRKNPVGLGAFTVTSVIPGEAVTLEANPYYWKGKPKLDGVIVEVVNPTNASSEFKNGKYDLMNVPTSKEFYKNFAELKNISILGSWQDVYNYLGFKVGKWDAKLDSVVFDKESKMANKSLRQAMGYALDLDTFATSFYDTLRKRANSLIPPVFKDLRDNELEGYVYNSEKAKKLLDEAGYKDVDGDGLREDLKGNKLTINLAYMSGDDGETQANYFVQQWKEIGLDVKLTTGRPIEFNAFYDLIENDDPSVDVYIAAWGVGGNPNPDTLWGSNSNNYTRFTSDKHAELLKTFNTSAMFDKKAEKEAYKAWQKYANDEAFAIPLLYRLNLTGVNKRVKALDISNGEKHYMNNLHKLELTADSPLKD